MQWGVRALLKQIKLGADPPTALDLGIQLMTVPSSGANYWNVLLRLVRIRFAQVVARGLLAIRGDPAILQ